MGIVSRLTWCARNPGDCARATRRRFVGPSKREIEAEARREKEELRRNRARSMIGSKRDHDRARTMAPVARTAGPTTPRPRAGGQRIVKSGNKYVSAGGVELRSSRIDEKYKKSQKISRGYDAATGRTMTTEKARKTAERIVKDSGKAKRGRQPKPRVPRVTYETIWGSSTRRPRAPQKAKGLSVSKSARRADDFLSSMDRDFTRRL